MRTWLRTLILAALLSGTMTTLGAAQTRVFPKSGELGSPDGRFLLRSSDREAPTTDLVGTFHSLWLVEVATGRSRKLCDYVGVASARWSESEHIVVTEYVSKKSSRLLLFSTLTEEEPLVLDKAAVTSLVSAEFREILRENDHVFVEGVGVKQGILTLIVWGNGQHDKQGFRWHCDYVLSERTVTCAGERSSQ
jgi:dipeptidyl aminopeptidase/acylaminoacyl peptidase